MRFSASRHHRDGAGRHSRRELILGAAAGLAGATLASTVPATALATTVTPDTAALMQLAVAAYVYGYPFVYDLTEVRNQTTNPTLRTGRPVNLFGHAATLSVPEERFVSVNNDTLYSVAHCDVRDEPLVLHVPDTDDRYYVMQFIDAWTNNFAYVGRRATGTDEATFVLAGPGWSGEAPSGVPVIEAPTGVFTIVGRYAVDGEADIPAVQGLQADTWLAPLSRYPDPPVADGRELGDWVIAPWDERVGAELLFWEQFRSWLALFPPPAAEHDLVASLAPLGLLNADSPYVDPDPELASLLTGAAAAGQQTIEDALSGSGGLVNGWTVGIHAFDYNVHHLGIGTIDSPEWRIDDRPRAFLTRAASARAGLWGNHGYEAAYFTAYVDDVGQPLSGSSSYRMHFPTPPPVDAFWSITMYDNENFYLVDNPIDRYSIGDRTRGLAYNDDGSLDISIGHVPPADDRVSNWLPAPQGGFRPVLRAYQPGPAILDGSYSVPAIQRLDEAGTA
jgi:hypothetical protein